LPQLPYFVGKRPRENIYFTVVVTLRVALPKAAAAPATYTQTFIFCHPI
jgi:hypothetical protein